MSYAEQELRVPSRLCFQGDHAIALMARIDRSEPRDGDGDRSRLDTRSRLGGSGGGGSAASPQAGHCRAGRGWSTCTRSAKEVRRVRCHLTVADEGGPLGGAFEDSRVYLAAENRVISGASHRPGAGVVMAETAVVSQELPTGPGPAWSWEKLRVVSQEGSRAAERRVLSGLTSAPGVL